MRAVRVSGKSKLKVLGFSTAWLLDNDRYALRAKLPVIGEGENTTWVNVARVGEWKGHGRGAFQLTLDTFKKFKANFDREQNEMMVSWEHGHIPGQERPAAGWIRELSVRDDGLWALVDFTERAKERIRAKEYRYCSIVFKLDATDNESGETIGPKMYELGLTNTPFMDGLEPLKLSAVDAAKGTPKMKASELMKAAIKALGPDKELPAYVKWIEAKKSLDAIASGEDDGEGSEEAAPPAEGEATEATEDKSEEEKKELAEDTPPAPGAEDGAAPDTEAAAGQALAMLEGLAAAVGVDVPTLLATMDEKQDQLVAMLGGVAEEEGGAPEAEAGATIANSRIAALQDELGKLKGELISLRQDRLEECIELSLERGELKGEKSDLIKAATDLGGHDKLIALAQTMGMTVPRGSHYAPKPGPGAKKGGRYELSDLDPVASQAARWLMAEGMTEDDAIAAALADKERTN